MAADRRAGCFTAHAEKVSNNPQMPSRRVSPKNKEKKSGGGGYKKTSGVSLKRGECGRVLQASATSGPGKPSRSLPGEPTAEQLAGLAPPGTTAQPAGLGSGPGIVRPPFSAFLGAKILRVFSKHQRKKFDFAEVASSPWERPVSSDRQCTREIPPLMKKSQRLVDTRLMCAAAASATFAGAAAAKRKCNRLISRRKCSAAF